MWYKFLYLLYIVIQKSKYWKAATFILVGNLDCFRYDDHKASPLDQTKSWTTWSLFKARGLGLWVGSPPNCT